ncbi:unnamed protein product [Sphagnum balticum]
MVIFYHELDLAELRNRPILRRQVKVTARKDGGVSYFCVKTGRSRYLVPVRGSRVVVKVPDSIEISVFYNGEFSGKSKALEFSDLKDGMELDVGPAGLARLQLRIKKIVYFIAKSESEDLDVLLERGGKVVSRLRFNIGDMKPHTASLVSVYSQEREALAFIARVESEERRIGAVCNLNYFREQEELLR